MVLKYEDLLFFSATTPLTKAELLYGLETTLALNGFEIVPVDDTSIGVRQLDARRNLEKDPSAVSKQP